MSVAEILLVSKKFRKQQPIFITRVCLFLSALSCFTYLRRLGPNWRDRFLYVRKRSLFMDVNINNNIIIINW